jgi:hypothetical protein
MPKVGYLKVINNYSFSDACRFHSSPPEFRDNLKTWPCCGKKSTDFSTFLAYPGCTKGLFLSNVN